MTENPAPEVERYCPLMSAAMPHPGRMVQLGSAIPCNPDCAWRVGDDCAVAVIAKKFMAG